jgi:XTP/dITP diphosphohydrolase
VRPRLCLATANPAKAAELRALVEPDLDAEILSLLDLPGVALPPEGETSYVDNARAKARAAADATGAIALADDSGIEVDALGGRPGVASARYGGAGLTDAERVTRLLAELAGMPRRTARFRCVLAVAAPWGAEAIFEGVVEGLLTDAPRGGGGFGYDPIFFVPEIGRTFAEIPAAEKHRWSHRGRAMADARPRLREWLGRARGPAQSA